ncbi:hypothetical protein EYF80_052469 [Liparis tanakae]|uniref:Uncharacterized protein n=1 Tax=Liparis tanakae TaxID=230148 RepID=A0A4Z2F901_9TELE|nr:hypothetical protein EYF80_052469 [Liparis tanakae]
MPLELGKGIRAETSIKRRMSEGANGANHAESDGRDTGVDLRGRQRVGATPSPGQSGGREVARRARLHTAGEQLPSLVRTLAL